MIPFLINVLLTWRLSSLLVNEQGPGDVLGLFRDKVGVAFDEQSKPYAKNIVAEILLCIWCTSVWVGWGVALVMRDTNWLANGLAYSAGAIVIERIVKRG